MTYQITVCDADAGFVKETASMAAGILKEEGIPFQIKTCCDTGELKRAPTGEEKTPDLLILDTGLASGVLLVPAGSRSLERGDKARPLWCLSKPISRETLREAIFTDYRNHFLKRTIVVRIPGGGVAQIAVDSILYIEILGKQLTVHTGQSHIMAGIPLTAIEKMLPPGRFVRCHRSFLVNLAAVRLLERYQITLRGGTTVPVGKQRYNEVRAVLLEGNVGKK